MWQTVALGVRHGLVLGGFLGKHFPAKQRSLEVQQSLRWRCWQRCSLRSQALEKKTVSDDVGVDTENGEWRSGVIRT